MPPRDEDHRAGLAGQADHLGNGDGVCEVRFKGWTLDLLADDMGVSPATALAIVCNEAKPQTGGALPEQSPGARGGPVAAEEKSWTVETDPETGDFRVLYNGAGKAITDPEEAWIELELWIAMRDGLIECVGFDSDDNSLWRSIANERALS